MATSEQTADFSIPNIEERDDLVLADDKGTLWTPGSISTAAERGALVASHVLGVDKQRAENHFTGQLEAMDLSVVPEDSVPVVSVSVGAEDSNGRVWTPTHIVVGHDRLKPKDGSKPTETYIWEEMFAKRPASWWNKTRSVGESRLVEAPLQLVLADIALRGTKKRWTEQQTELQKLVDDHKSEVTTLEGMTPLDWIMMDADAIVGGTERPDKQTVTRFVQHEQDRSDAGGSYGPRARVDGGRADLRGSRDGASPLVGFRTVMGQRQPS